MSDSTPIPDTGDLKHRAVAVIPCYNAGSRVRGVVEQALSFVDRVVLVDDGSTDGGTAGLEDLPITRIVFSQNRGKGHALIEGIRRAVSLPGVEVVALLDADGQHDPRELPGLYDVFRAAGADLLIGARHLDKTKTPWRSRFGNRVTAWVSQRLFACPLDDTQCGYRLLSPRFAEAFAASVPGGRYETEMRMILFAVRSGHKLASAPVRTLYEPGNRSSHFRKVRDSLRIYAVLLRSLYTQHRLTPPGTGGVT